MRHGVVLLGVERLALRVDPLEALLGKDVEKGARHLLYVLAAPVGQCQVGRVQDGQQLFNQRGRGILDHLALLALDALAVIVELGLEAEQSIEVLVPLVAPVDRSVSSLTSR